MILEEGLGPDRLWFGVLQIVVSGAEGAHLLGMCWRRAIWVNRVRAHGCRGVGCLGTTGWRPFNCWRGWARFGMAPGGCRRSWWLAGGDLEGRPQTRPLPVGIESSADGVVVECRGHEGFLPGCFCAAGKLWIQLGVDNHAISMNNKVAVRTSLRTGLYQADPNCGLYQGHWP